MALIIYLVSAIADSIGRLPFELLPKETGIEAVEEFLKRFLFLKYTGEWFNFFSIFGLFIFVIFWFFSDEFFFDLTELEDNIFRESLFKLIPFVLIFIDLYFDTKISLIISSFFSNFLFYIFTSFLIWELSEWVLDRFDTFLSEDEEWNVITIIFILLILFVYILNSMD